MSDSEAVRLSALEIAEIINKAIENERQRCLSVVDAERRHMTSTLWADLRTAIEEPAP